MKAIVSATRTVASGEGISYGWLTRAEGDRCIATVPLGYADGVPRGLSDAGAHVLIGGRRQPIAGRITMDQFMVDCGPVGESTVAPGDEVVLIGTQGDERITADDWAELTGTISYEVLSRIGARVDRRYV